MDERTDKAHTNFSLFLYLLEMVGCQQIKVLKDE